jgi:hypothetical protein
MPATMSTTGTPSHFDVASLHLVKLEIDVSLKQVESALSIFVDDEHNTAGLMDAADAMMQIHGILRLLELYGASELSGAMGKLLRDIAENPAQTKEDRLSAIGEGLMVLSRYLEFVLLRETLLPHLLLPVTNTLNRLAGLPVLREGHFLKPYLSVDQLSSQGVVGFDDVSQTSLIQFLAKMYRSGLAQVLNDVAQPRDYQLLQRACQEMATLSSNTPSALYWQAAQAATTELYTMRSLSASRKRVLVSMERRFSKINQLIAADELLDVLAMAVCRDHDLATQLRDALTLTDKVATDRTTAQLAGFLFGPDGDVIHTVTNLIHEEIGAIKTLIDTIARGEALEGGYGLVAERMNVLAKTLSILNLNDAVAHIEQQSAQIRGWTEAPNQDHLNNLMDALMIAENATTLLSKSYTPGAVSLPLNNMRISLHQLDTACSMLITESRGTLGMAMRSLLSFIESNGDMLHMDNVPVMLESVSGAMEFLNAPRGRDILKKAASYVASHFGAGHEAPPMSDIDRLADAITCIDYYLESVEVKKPAGERPFRVGERSLAELNAA